MDLSVFPGTSKQPGIPSSLLGGNPQGPGVRSRNASSRRFNSAVSSVLGKNHFLTVGLGYPICKNMEMQQVVSKVPLCSKILGPCRQGNQRQEETSAGPALPGHSSSVTMKTQGPPLLSSPRRQNHILLRALLPWPHSGSHGWAHTRDRQHHFLALRRTKL